MRRFNILSGILAALMLLPVSAHADIVPVCPSGEVFCEDAGGCIPDSCVCLLEPLPNGTKVLCAESGTVGGSLFFQYLNYGGMFRWGLSIGAALAILNVTYGGFQIMTAGADPAGLEAGKVRIMGSILGLIFLMFAGVLLNFINPLAFQFS